MCFGGGASAPEVKYVGPSDDDIRRNEESLAQYQQQMATQQSDFQSQLQSQIDSANAETAELQADFAAETAAQQASDAAATAAAAAGSSADQAAAYTTSAQKTEIPEGAQTTAAVTEKKKPKKSLKISTAGTASSAGSGLNIGV
jgi:peptidoglycan hydrolase CwlO-like protein